LNRFALAVGRLRTPSGSGLSVAHGLATASGWRGFRGDWILSFSDRQTVRQIRLGQ
jgi:hypothetical protein